jgi:hypothetical protein
MAKSSKKEEPSKEMEEGEERTIDGVVYRKEDGKIYAGSPTIDLSKMDFSCPEFQKVISIKKFESLKLSIIMCFVTVAVLVITWIVYMKVTDYFGEIEVLSLVIIIIDAIIVLMSFEAIKDSISVWTNKNRWRWIILNEWMSEVTNNLKLKRMNKSKKGE